MKSVLFSCTLWLAAAPVMADAIDAPGPMEYLEVTDVADPGAAQRERSLLVESIAASLLEAGKREQVQLLLLQQKGHLDQLLQREERARAEAEAERLRQEREAARGDEGEGDLEEAS